MTLNLTLDQVRDRVVAGIGTKNIPAPWWKLPTGNDCLGYLLWCLGLRTADDFAPHYISISAFRAWAGWDEVAVADLQAGDLPLWNFTGGQIPEHAEFGYSFNHPAKQATTVSANTGPKPGIPVPRGVWKKTRPTTGSLLFGIRPPYLEQAAGTDKKRKEVVRFIAGYLNGLKELNSIPNTAAENDGVEGPVYWTLVQTWGRLHHLYGAPPPHETYVIDGVPGPRTKQVEAAIFKAAKAG